MARCGCTKFPTCSCVILGDPSTTTVFGSGNAQAPYEVSVNGYPNPRPFASVFKSFGLTLVNNSFVVASTGTAQYLSQITPPIWDGASKLIAPIAGTYYLNGGSITGLGGTYTTGTQFLRYSLRLNGTTILAAQTRGVQDTNITPNAVGSVSTVHRLIAGDYIELLIYLGIVSGGTPTMADAFWEMRWMGL